MASSSETEKDCELTTKKPVHESKEEIEESIAKTTDVLCDQFAERIRILLDLGRADEAMKNVKAMAKITGFTSKFYKAQLETFIRLDQIDNIIDFDGKIPHDPSWDPEAAIESYLEKYAKYNAFPHSHPYAKKHIDFIRWMRRCGATLNYTKLVLYAEDYRGLHATVDIKPDETILSIPIKMAITVDSVAQSELGKAIIKQQMLDEEWQAYVFAVIFVLEERTKKYSHLQPWIDTLPVRAWDYPMFFNESERLWLQGSNCLIALKNEKELLLNIYKKIGTLSSEFGKKHSFDDFIHCYYIIVSRQFRLSFDGKTQICLMPYADMANTACKGNNNTAWEYNSIAQAFQYKALSSIEKDTPILLNYGHDSNFVYFTYYGFAFNDDRYDSVGFLFMFDQSIPNADLKKKLIFTEPYDYKLEEFYANYEDNFYLNEGFMTFCRFYWSEAKPEVLVKSVIPEAESVEKITPEKRKSGIGPTNVASEKRMLEGLLGMAKKNLALYPTTIEEDETKLKEEGLSYKRKFSYYQVIGEKKSLKTLIEMAEIALKLLSLGTLEKAKEYYEALPEKPSYSYYIETDLFYLEWK